MLKIFPTLYQMIHDESCVTYAFSRYMDICLLIPIQRQDMLVLGRFDIFYHTRNYSSQSPLCWVRNSGTSIV